MATIRLDKFSGIAPEVSPRLLNQEFGLTTENVDLSSGKLFPKNTDRVEYYLESADRNRYKSLYMYRLESNTTDGIVKPADPIKPVEPKPEPPDQPDPPPDGQCPTDQTMDGTPDTAVETFAVFDSTGKTHAVIEMQYYDRAANEWKITGKRMLFKSGALLSWSQEDILAARGSLCKAIALSIGTGISAGVAYCARAAYYAVLNDATGTVQRMTAEEPPELLALRNNMHDVWDDHKTRADDFGARGSAVHIEEALWMLWKEDNVHAVSGPVPNDLSNRLYFTGNGKYPQMARQVDIEAGAVNRLVRDLDGYRLGMPSPASPIVATSDYVDDPNTYGEVTDVAYVFTYVSSLGEEGPPSPVSNIVPRVNGTHITLELRKNYDWNNAIRNDFTTQNWLLDPTNSKIRIYRANTGSTTTFFQFMTEIPLGAIDGTDVKMAPFVDNIEPVELGEVLPSQDWLGPPDDQTKLYPYGPLQGLMNISNGVLAGYSGNRLCFSEPYMPHAWPIAYRITIEDIIIGIATVANGVICFTKNNLYFVTGTDPSAMTSIRIDFAQACVNTKSIVDMGNYVLYASADGLCAIEGASGQVVTTGLISPRQWRTEWYPNDYQAFRFKDGYMAFTTLFNDDGTINRHYAWHFNPRKETGILGTVGQSQRVRGGYWDPATGQLFVINWDRITDHCNDVLNRRRIRFHSKEFNLPRPTSFSWLMLDAQDSQKWRPDREPWQFQNVVLQIVADGYPVCVVNISRREYTKWDVQYVMPAGIPAQQLAEPIVRMPAHVATKWEIYLESNHEILSVTLAQSIEELRAV